MSNDFSLLRAFIREEMEFYGKVIKTLGTSSSGEIEIDHAMEELQSVEGHIQQLQVTPQRMYGPEDTKKLDALNARRAELEQQIRDLQDIL